MFVVSRAGVYVAIGAEYVRQPGTSARRLSTRATTHSAQKLVVYGAHPASLVYKTYSIYNTANEWVIRRMTPSSTDFLRMTLSLEWLDLLHSSNEWQGSFDPCSSFVVWLNRMSHPTYDSRTITLIRRMTTSITNDSFDEWVIRHGHSSNELII